MHADPDVQTLMFVEPTPMPETVKIFPLMLVCAMVPGFDGTLYGGVPPDMVMLYTWPTSSVNVLWLNCTVPPLDADVTVTGTVPQLPEAEQIVSVAVPLVMPDTVSALPPKFVDATDVLVLEAT